MTDTEHPPLLITAGPTHEPIDAVRYLGNRSSGRMGIALAEHAARRGYPVTLLLGPVDIETLPTHSHLNIIRFRTAADLQHLLESCWPRHIILIMAAAVADFRPRSTSPTAHTTKLDRRHGPITLTLDPVPDLLQHLIPFTHPHQRTIGFALEPAPTLESAAREKLHRKRLDAIIANPLETMGAADITARLLLRDGATLAPPAATLSKADFAAWIIDQLPRICALPPASADASHA